MSDAENEKGSPSPSRDQLEKGLRALECYATPYDTTAAIYTDRGAHIILPRDFWAVELYRDTHHQYSADLRAFTDAFFHILRAQTCLEARGYDTAHPGYPHIITDLIDASLACAAFYILQAIHALTDLSPIEKGWK